jgi:hypothetical protein
VRLGGQDDCARCLEIGCTRATDLHRGA